VLRDALHLIKTCWPEMHEELARTVQCLVPIKAASAIGAADLCSHGTVFMNIRRFSAPTKLAEELIHEASHVRLNMLMAPADVVLNDPTERFASPLRRDARPMFGVFHQVFVLSRILEFYRRVARVDPRQARHVSAVAHQLADGLMIVRRHGRLSAVGQELLHSMSRQCESALSTEN
jgi:HEXXH motif-containing protein